MVEQNKAKRTAKNIPAKAAKTVASRKTIHVTLVGSPIGRPGWALATLKGLGLNKRHRSRVIEDTPAMRGMVERVKHLLRIDAA